MRSECQCELEQQSEHSPSVVGDDERIVFALIDPLTFENSVARFSKSQLKAGTLSICRSDHCSSDEAHEAIVAPLVAKDPTRQDLGVYWATCQEIRSIMLVDGGGEGAFCVADDGLAHYPAHAHLGYSQPTDKKHLQGNLRETARAKLADAFRRRGIHAWADAPFRQDNDNNVEAGA
ncbi:MAG TPA: hypothetical protein VGV39_04525 [Mesorhizobium sp.]|jgi:hypothetical protein|uniref:hypothetical protein n=1 Tax=Mesorhizobium sp. TaxID=1871066 RepID=UPI002DDD5E38|nr:hypothetical protein [Mesorhizobium sp.]HEV2502313.1 hypothetical protein [Mesorhizobium sp.]